jgi:hypothetical protein
MSTDSVQVVRGLIRDFLNRHDPSIVIHVVQALARRLAGEIKVAIGLGTMGMSDLHGPAEDGESIATIQAALDAGVSLIDVGDYYGSGHNELLIARALRDRYADGVALSVKIGGQHDPAGGWVGFDASPAAVKDRLAHTLMRLDVDHVDIYRRGRLDSNVPIEETVGAIAEMVVPMPQWTKTNLSASAAAGETGSSVPPAAHWRKLLAPGKEPL